MAQPTSAKPYLLRAVYEWCVDNGFTPYLAVAVDANTRVPADYVSDGKIVLNISPLAASRLQMGNERIEFMARFGGVAREVSVPIEAVAAIYARENGQGISFDSDAGAIAAAREQSGSHASESLEPPEPPRSGSGRPALRRIK